jgi:GTPase SAR1 family protein
MQPLFGIYGVDIPVLAILLVGGLVVGIEVAARRKYRLKPITIPLYLFVGLVEAWDETGTDTPSSGRERYRSGNLGSIKLQFARVFELLTDRDTETVHVDEIYYRDPDGKFRPYVPDGEASSIYLGQSGKGKSTLVKSRCKQWDTNEPIIAHALSERAGENEFIDFFESEGRHVIRLSSRGSEVRWDPLLDYDNSPEGMETLATALYESRQTKTTGWDEPAKALLVAGLAITNTKHGDITMSESVLAQSRKEILEELKKVPQMGTLESGLRELSHSDFGQVKSVLLNQMRPLFKTDMFDAELDRISLEDYFNNPSGAVIVLDNIRKDKHARPFWRLLIQTAIDVAFETPGRQRFILDEADKLPAIANLDELVSRGRSAQAIGIVMVQDVNQLVDVYGEDITTSMWANCPNSICFRPGDNKTAELALSAIGQVEVVSQNVSRPTGETDVDRQTTRQYEDKYPFPTGVLTSLETGEAFIHTDHGWWVCDLAEE